VSCRLLFSLSLAACPVADGFCAGGDVVRRTECQRLPHAQDSRIASADLCGGALGPVDRLQGSVVNPERRAVLRPVRDVDVAPTQTEQFPAPGAGRDGHEDEQVELRPGAASWSSVSPIMSASSSRRRTSPRIPHAALAVSQPVFTVRSPRLGAVGKARTTVGDTASVATLIALAPI
jgi:hypothetical protein